jgi:hypothetical protein
MITVRRGPKPIDLTGQRFGRWVVLSRAPRTKKQIQWNCRCDCGRLRVVAGDTLILARTKSCGCYKAKLLSLKTRIHGESEFAKKGSGRPVTVTREYRAWCSMKQRCFNENCKAYQWYGARGITICERWLKSFPAFLEDMGRCPPGLTLDRKDNDGNYEPVNCRWADLSTQRRNQRPAKRHDAYI